MVSNELRTDGEASSRWCELSDREQPYIGPDTLGALILEVEDDCATHFCHELHDGLSQLLMALQAHLQVHDLASRAGKLEKAAEEMAKSRECLNQSVRECRRLVSIQSEEHNLAVSLETLLRESGARWNWAAVDVHDLRSATASIADSRAERLLLLLCRRMVSAFRRKSGISACLELRDHVGPQTSLCADFTVTGETLAAFPFAGETSSTTESILKRTQGLTEALGGTLRFEAPSPTEIHLAIIIPAGEPMPGTSYAASQPSKEARHVG